MSQLFRKALTLLVGDTSRTPSVTDFLRMPTNRPARQLTERQLINLESQIGAKLFGELPGGHRREFFCLDEHTWIWHEEWLDEHKKLQVMTTRYEIQDKGILKVQPGPRYTYLEGEELNNLLMATRLYYEQVAREVYHRDPQTGDKLHS